MVDLALAPRDAHGEVVFTADFYLLKPVDARRANGRLYYEVPNRGGKGLLGRLQYADGSLDPASGPDFGDGWLMRQGFAIAWMGWQWDVPERPGVLRLRAPVATDHGRPITGLVRAMVITDSREPKAPLGDRGHLAYPAVDPAGTDSALWVRDHALDTPRLLPRASWRFADETTVALDGGFEPGRIYEVVYRSRDPRVAGCGFAATRDFVSFLKNAPAPANPLAGVRLAIAHGVSQSGRFLRHFLYEGFNEDEQGRRVFDGVLADVAGAGRGDFNRRFAQASRDGHQHWNVHYATDAFPFTDLPEADPATGARRGLLDRAVATDTVPKLFHSFGAYEYWNRAASLVTTDASATRDAELPTTSRVYFVASAQHGPGRIPPAAAGSEGALATNPNDYRPALRALVHALDLWVADGVLPPPSRYARLRDGTLAAPEKAGWPEIPGVRFPAVRNEPPRLDFGPGWGRRCRDRRAAAARPRLPRARSRRGRRRQRPRGHPAAGDRGATRDADRMELARGGPRRRGRARRIPRLLRALRADEGRARRLGRPTALDRGALPGRTRRLPRPRPSRRRRARGRPPAARRGRAARRRARGRPLGLFAYSPSRSR